MSNISVSDMNVSDMNKNDILIDIKKVKNLLNSKKQYYKNDNVIQDIINNSEDPLHIKLDKVNQHLIEKRKLNPIKKNKKREIVFENIEFRFDMPIDEMKELLKKKKEEIAYQRNKKMVNDYYHQNPEYSASLKIRRYKKYIDIHPEVKSIFENEEITKVQKLEQIREFLKKLPKKSS